jgi:hypothetical protein
MLTRDEIILAAECCIAGNCGACPFINRGNCITDFMKNVLECIKNEPAPAATGTSSEVVSKDTDNIRIDDSTKERICQEAEKAYKACELILEIYERMDDSEQKAFELGHSYQVMSEVQEELARIGKGGEGNG